MAADRFVLGFPRLLILLVAAGFLFLTVPAAQGQGHQGREIAQDRPSDPTHSTQLPDWAEPAAPSSRSNARSKGGVDESFRTNSPPPPPPQPPVPVDGGIALLAAAGAGYAVRKLNQDDEEDDEPA